MQRRKHFLAGLAGATAALASARMAAGQTRPVVRMAGVMSDLFGQPFFIKDSGTLARRGYDVDVSNMNNVGAVLAAMAGGSLDLGVADIILGTKAILGGAPVLMIAGSGLYLANEPSAIIAVAPGSPYHTAKDLIGKTVGVPTLGALTASTLLAWLPKNGVDPSQVKLVEVPQSAVVPALERGTIEAGLLGEPFITGAGKRVRDMGHPYDVIGKQFPVSVWYAAKSWLDADPARARTVVAGIYDNARWANAHQSDTFDILVRDAHFDRDALKGMIRTTFTTSLTPAEVQPTLDFCTQFKIIDRHVDAATVIAKL